MIDFSQLKSEQVLAEGMLASDVRSLWKRLSNTPEVQSVVEALTSAPQWISSLCDLTQQLLEEDYDPRYRHQNDIALCAIVAALQDSPHAKVVELFNSLKRQTAPSLHWVRQLAEFCDERRAGNNVVSWVEPPDLTVKPILTEVSRGALVDVGMTAFSLERQCA